MKISPVVSVILPVFNGEEQIKSSVESILAQTFPDFELIVLNDGSKDNTLSILNDIRDERLVIADHPNMGMGRTLNRGIELAKGKFIARQDHDDISLPDRLSKQVAFMQKNPDVVLAGTYAEIVDSNGKSTGRFHRHPTSDIELKANLYFDNPFVHSSVILRSDILKKEQYNTSIHSLLQDFELWFRLSQKYSVANIPEVLLQYMEVNVGMSRTTVNYAEVVAGQCFLNLMQLVNDPKLKEFALFYHRCFERIDEMDAAIVKKTIASITKAFSARFGTSVEETEMAFSEVKKHLKKVLLDYKVHLSGSNKFKKLISKTERRLFYPRK